MTQGDGDDELGILAQLALQLDIATHSSYGSLHRLDIQPHMHIDFRGILAVIGLEQVFDYLGRHTLAAVFEFEPEHAPLDRHADIEVGLVVGMVQHIGQQIAKNLVDIIGHEVGLYLVALGGHHKTYLALRGLMAIGFDQHAYISHDVVVTPLCLVDGSDADIGDIHHTVYQMEQTTRGCLKLRHLVAYLLVVGLRLYGVARRLDDGHRCAQFVRDIGEEAHTGVAELPVGGKRAGADAQEVIGERQEDYHTYHDERKHEPSTLLLLAHTVHILAHIVELARIVGHELVYLHILDITQFLQVHHRVVPVLVVDIGSEGFGCIARLAINLIIEQGYLRAVARRVDFVGGHLGLLQILDGGGGHLSLDVDTRKAYAGPQAEIAVGVGHQGNISLVVLGSGLGIVAPILVEAAILDTNERHTHLVVNELFLLHGFLEIELGRVEVVLGSEHSADIRIVERHTKSAAQLDFAGKRAPEVVEGCLVVADGIIDFSQTVEYLQLTLEGRGSGVAPLLAVAQTKSHAAGGKVHGTQTAVVGTQFVEGIDDFHRVADTVGHSQPLLVGKDGATELVVYTICPTQPPQHNRLAHTVARLAVDLEPVLQVGGVGHRVQLAFYLFVLRGIVYRYRLLVATASKKQQSQNHREVIDGKIWMLDGSHTLPCSVLINAKMPQN